MYSRISLLLLCSLLFVTANSVFAIEKEPVAERPNVLLIAVDDLNDWIGCLGGHPQAKTPNIDKLAGQGVLFKNAYCQSPVCNPSRASMMTGLYPETTGIYFLNPPIAASKVASKALLMPERFQQEGYAVTAAGKLFHGGENTKYLPNYAGSFGGFGPFPKKKLTKFPGVKLWDWGAFPQADEQTPDHKLASWAIAELDKKHGKPLWLGVGFYRPHVPQYVPQKWLDMYPLETLQLPDVLKEDLADLPDYGVKLTRLKHIAPTQDWVTENDEWKPLVQSYLGCVSFVDHQVGRVLDALAASDYADNTIVVLYTDHGFHLGEKERWAKRSLWQDGCRVPLIIAGPGISEGKVCAQSAQLMDIYPTLLELTGLEPDDALEGNSLKPLLTSKDAAWPHMARTSFGPGNVAISSATHRYIHYNDGSEEFYDITADPHEWKNLVANPTLKTLVDQHRAELPKTYHQVLGSGSTGHKAYEATESLLRKK
jgi:arylsulfatase A-like enzyme